MNVAPILCSYRFKKMHFPCRGVGGSLSFLLLVCSPWYFFLCLLSSSLPCWKESIS